MRVAVAGAELEAGDRGRGPATVVLHGLLSSRAHEEAAGLRPDTALPDRVVRYDARGHGRSTGGTEPVCYAWPALAGDLLAVLDALAPGEQVDGVGTSMGAATLLHAAVVRPAAFRRLVLVIPPTAWATRVAAAAGYRTLAAMAERSPAAVLAAISAAPLPPAFAGRRLPPPDVAFRLMPAVLRGAAASDLPAADALRALDLPTLLLPWSGDVGHPLETATALRGLLPRAELVVADDLDARPALVAGFLRGNGVDHGL